MNIVLNCPSCRETLWAMRCGAQLGGSDLIVCVACDFFEPVGAWVAEQVVALNLGSGLIDHSQKMTVAAMHIADKKVWAQRS